jgi:putative ABC transport system permease protein
MLISHLKLALKVLGRRKVFTAISLFGVALTLLVLTVAAAFLDHLFAPHAPDTRQDRTLVAMYMELSGERATSRGPASFKVLDATRDLPGVERMSIASMPQAVSAFHEGRRRDLTMRRADGEYWNILDFRFLEGASFTADDVAAARHVAVINETTRRRIFGDGPAVGRTLEAGGETWTVVGVVPDVALLRFASHAEIWTPVTTQRGDTWRTQLEGNLIGLYLLAPGAEPGLVQSEFQARVGRVDLRGSEYDTITMLPDTLLGNMARMSFGSRRDTESKVGMLLGVLALVAFLFALLPTVNLVNLTLSRIYERTAEIGVRKAFGAPTHSLVLQFVLENVVLTLLGGLLALAASVLVLRGINASGLIPYSDLRLNGRILAQGLLMAVAFGVLSGAWPAWRMARLHPVVALQGGPR